MKIKDKEKKYTLKEITCAWYECYGEYMQDEYKGFLHKLSEENDSQDSNPAKGSDNNKLGV
tara:strand:+ start:208 stop:390 length:183 start_codon:yes stop_codon:yes gene_type:complete